MVAALLSVLREEELASIAGDPQAGPVGAPLWDDCRLQELRSLVLTLSDLLTARGVTQWLHAANRLLGGRPPLEALQDGDVRRVREAAESFIEGAYV
jgi:hypothetical protein